MLRRAHPAWLRWAALPLVPAQAVWLNRSIERFPDADGRTGRVGSGDRRMKVVALGDSVTAGYAVRHHSATVAGRMAALLSERCDATVDWEVHAISGFTAGRAHVLVGPERLHDADLVFVSVGVNDLKNLHSRARFHRELGRLLDAILIVAPHAQICLLGIPPLQHFPAFPRPLADVLGWRGRTFDAIGRAAAAERERIYRIEAEDALAPEMYGPDGFHPSEAMHAAFAEAAVAGYRT